MGDHYISVESAKELAAYGLQVVNLDKSADFSYICNAFMHAMLIYKNNVGKTGEIFVCIGSRDVFVPCDNGVEMCLRLPNNTVATTIGRHIYVNADKLLLYPWISAVAIALEELYHAGCSIYNEDLVKAMVINSIPDIRYESSRGYYYIGDDPEMQLP